MGTDITGFRRRSTPSHIGRRPGPSRPTMRFTATHGVEIAIDEKISWREHELMAVVSPDLGLVLQHAHGTGQNHCGPSWDPTGSNSRFGKNYLAGTRADNSSEHVSPAQYLAMQWPRSRPLRQLMWPNSLFGKISRRVLELPFAIVGFRNFNALPMGVKFTPIATGSVVRCRSRSLR